MIASFFVVISVCFALWALYEWGRMRGVDAYKPKAEMLNTVVSILDYYKPTSEVLKDARRTAGIGPDSRQSTETKLYELLDALEERIVVMKTGLTATQAREAEVKKVLVNYGVANEAEFGKEKLSVLIALALHKKNEEIKRLSNSLSNVSSNRAKLNELVWQMDDVLKAMTFS